MPPQNLSSLISAAVVPVVIISACGLLALALYNRLSAVVSRVRAFHRERLHETERVIEARLEADPLGPERRAQVLGMLELQSRRVSRRARLIRRALMCILGCIAAQLLCSLLLGLSVLLPQALFAAVPMFVAGLLLALAAVVFALTELTAALEPVEMEDRFIAEWGERRLHLEDAVAPPPLFSQSPLRE